MRYTSTLRSTKSVTFELENFCFVGEISVKIHQSFSGTVNYIINEYKFLLEKRINMGKDIQALRDENEKLKDNYNKLRDKYLKTQELLEKEVVKRNVQDKNNS